MDYGFSVSVTNNDSLLPACKALYWFFFLNLDLTVVQLNTVAFWGTIADRCDQEICSLMELDFIHKDKVINVEKCYCNTKYIILF